MMQSDQATAHEKAHSIGMESHSIRPEDFEWMVLQHQKQIYRVLFFLLKDADAAETLTQECFLRAFKRHSSFRGESSLTTWLIAIAVNLAHDHNRNRRWAFWRRLARTDRIESMPMPDAGRSPEQILADKESIDVVQSAVNNLPERQKTVFLLRFVEEMSLESIAEVMDLEVGTVKTHLFRAVNAVRRASAEGNTRGRTSKASMEHSDAKRQR